LETDWSGWNPSGRGEASRSNPPDREEKRANEIFLAKAGNDWIESRMIKSTTWCGMMAAGLLALGGTAQAGTVRSYQVTGPVLEVSDSMIAVQKGKDRWEIARDAKTKMKGDVKVGTKVTIMYTMTATEVEVKPEKAAKKP
jgi:hypothetical protein